ncbi:MAG: hypothetical protein JF603_10150 [Acidobacteria bacterium]|nr:hypothetical protein [Acidobacteriota bacterium]
MSDATLNVTSAPPRNTDLPAIVTILLCMTAMFLSGAVLLAVVNGLQVPG